jgi:hypothetical protein
MEAQARPAIELGKRPRVKQEPETDHRRHTTIPLRATTDPRIKPAALRVLCQLCAYANRAGLLWVGQRRIAKDLGVTIAAINRQVVRLKNYGYLERIHRGFSGQKADTLRVIYDPEITAEQAIAVASGLEDCRSPSMVARDEYRLAFETGMIPIRSRSQPVSKPKQVRESCRLTIEQGLAGFDRVTEADMRALAVAIEAGLTSEAWQSAREQHPAASVAELVLVCNGANERMPANS